MPSLSQRIKLYRRLRYRKGHGVHSPFAFHLITKVIEEKSSYYIFDDIEKIRKELLMRTDVVSYSSKKGKIRTRTVGEITAKEAQSQKYGALLFRLVNYFQCKYVLEIGAGTGIMSLYLCTPSSECRCIALERRPELAKIAAETGERLQLKGLTVISEEYIGIVEKIMGEYPQIDMIFINTAYDSDLTQLIVEDYLLHVKKNTILIIDGINKNSKMKKMWKKIKELRQTSMTVDLHALGLVFLNNKIYKKNYITYFDHGKKQNIYPDRRRRFNFLSWRKKGIQNKSEA